MPPPAGAGRQDVPEPEVCVVGVLHKGLGGDEPGVPAADDPAGRFRHQQAGVRVREQLVQVVVVQRPAFERRV